MVRALEDTARLTSAETISGGLMLSKAEFTLHAFKVAGEASYLLNPDLSLYVMRLSNTAPYRKMVKVMQRS